MNSNPRQHALEAARTALAEIHSEVDELRKRLQYLDADLSTPQLSARTVVWVEEDTRLALEHMHTLRAKCEMLRMTVMDVISPSGFLRAISDKGERNDQ